MTFRVIVVHLRIIHESESPLHEMAAYSKTKPLWSESTAHQSLENETDREREDFSHANLWNAVIMSEVNL